MFPIGPGTEGMRRNADEAVKVGLRQDRSFPKQATRALLSSTAASWLNQTEIWFSILARKLLRRASFTSKEHLKARIEAFVAYFNRTLAKPFKRTMTGKPLAA